ncbi:MAG: hypothetical protein ACFUZC_04845 [Chthoniobacteraceae bacterium]
MFSRYNAQPMEGMVGRIRFNLPDSGRPAVESEFVRSPEQSELALEAEPSVEWTTHRVDALVLPLEQAEALAKRLGFPAHVLTVSHAVRVDKPLRSAVSPTAAYEHLEKRGLA